MKRLTMKERMKKNEKDYLLVNAATVILDAATQKNLAPSVEKLANARAEVHGALRQVFQNGEAHIDALELLHALGQFMNEHDIHASDLSKVSKVLDERLGERRPMVIA